MNLNKVLLYVISPTYFYADYKKKKLNDQEKARFIIIKNKKYFIFSFITFLIFLIINSLEILTSLRINDIYINYRYPLLFLLFYYYFSRVNEIFVSYLLDVYDKLNNDNQFSFLMFKDRIKLAFYSYLELIINYTLMFWMIYISFGLFNNDNYHLLNLLYYSCFTIATLGYGDIYSIHFIPQLLSVYEVFNGMLLVIVCFTIYVSLNFNQEVRMQMENDHLNYIPDDDKIRKDYMNFKFHNKINFMVAIMSIIIVYMSGFLIITKQFQVNIFVSLIIYIIFTFVLITLLNKNVKL